GTDLERMQAQPVLDHLGRHQDPRHQRAALRKIEGASAKKVPSVADRAEAIVVLDVDERRGHDEPGGCRAEHDAGDEATPADNPLDWRPDGWHYSASPRGGSYAENTGAGQTACGRRCPAG